MAKGVKSITGNASPEVGEKNFYEVSSFYQGTVIKNENEIKWKLYTQQSSGNWRELRGPQKTGKKVPFSFPEKWLGKKLLIEAFVYNPEVKSPPGLIVAPKTAKIPRINKVELFYVDDKKGSVFSFMEKLRARAYCVNMFLKELTFTLWEDDAKGGGHNTNNKPIRTLKARVDKNGVAVVEFPLSEAYMKKAMEGEVDVKQLEFYVTVEYYKNKKHSTENVDVDNPNPKVPINPPKKTEPKQPPKAKGSPAENKPKSKKEEKGILDKLEEKWDELWDWWETPGTIKKEQLPTLQKPEGRSVSIVDSNENENSEKSCYCLENQFYWGNKLTCEERKKVLQVCSDLWGEENKVQRASELMSVMHLETDRTFSPSKDNGAGYSGLIQFSDSSAKSVGTTRSALKKMTFIEQMDYVKAYFEKKKTSLNTMTDLYLLVLKQNAVGQGQNPNYILFDESVSVPNVPYNKDNLNREPWVTKYGYSSNPSFMRESGEYTNRRKFQSYSRGLIDRRGFPGGKTYVWEVTDKLTKEHYNLGKAEVYVSQNCTDQPKKKSKDGEYPPWVDVAIAEEKKIIRESTHCSYIINTYHNATSNARMKRCGSESDASRSNSAWCGAFVAYCIKTSGYKFQPDPGAIWHGKVNLVKRDKSGAPYETQEKWGVKHTEMYIGGIVEWHNNGHTTIVVGIDKGNPNNYILLGGNQDNGVRFWTAPKTKVKPYCIFPIDYEGDLLPLENIEPEDLSSGAQKSAEGSTS